MVDAKSWICQHSDRVCLIVLGMASAFGAGEAELGDLRRAALPHDLGKLAAFTSAESRQVQRHPLVTEQILTRLPGHEHLAALAGAHHERLGGGGYPRGRSAPELTRSMRLLAIADVYEALTAQRPYRRALRSEQALSIPDRLDAEAFAVLDRLPAGEPDARERSVQATLDVARLIRAE